MRRIDVTRYYCDPCDKRFDTEEECEEHESTHYTNWEGSDNNEIAEALHNLSNRVFDYRVKGTALGYFVSDFSALMEEAAKRLEGKDK